MPSETSTSDDRLRRQMASLARFGLHSFRSEDLDELLQRAAELVSEGLGVRLTKILELLPGDEGLLTRAGVNWAPGVIGQVLGPGTESPAGYALILDEPVISRDLSAETRFGVPEVLVEHGVNSVINVVIPGSERPFGVLEVDSPQHREFDEDDADFLQNYANLIGAAVERQKKERALEDSVGEQKLLALELAHRVKNILALVQSLAVQTAANEPPAREYRDLFLSRLQALSNAESLAFEDRERTIELGRLVALAVQPFSGENGGAIETDGPPVRLPARSGRIIALVLHELGTNATKHGALSAPEGSVRVSWRIERSPAGRRLRLRWAEQGAPAATPPARQGFGTRLLTVLAGYELDGEAELDHGPGGTTYELVFPVTPQ